MNTSPSPSIFTPKDSLSRGSTRPTLSQRPPRTSSPFRRQSTPECPHPSAVQTHLSAASLATSSRPFVQTLEAADSSIAQTYSSTSPSQPSIWTSFADPLPASNSSIKHTPKARSVSLGDASGAKSAFSEYLPPPPPRTPPGSEPRLKRKLAPVDPFQDRAPTSEPASKRPKLRPKTKHILDSNTYIPAEYAALVQPPSPLFFSNSPQPRPTLPPRFSSSEAGARMLSEARTEGEPHIKTVSLARGTVTTPSLGIPLPLGSPRGGRRSVERSSTARSSSPDVGGSVTRDGMANALNSIGIIELLEQDERPTFILDLGDSSNYGPGPLQLVFCNPALRSYEGLLALISGTAPDDSPGPTTFLQFKAWLFSATVAGESLHVCLPSYSYSGMTWSCSTVRKRFRIIAGAFISPPATTAAAMRVSIPPAEQVPEAVSAGQFAEGIDYFSALSGPKDSSDSSSGTVTEVMPTIEPPATNVDTPTLLQVPRDHLSGAVNLLPDPSTYVSPLSNAGAIDTSGANSVFSSPPDKGSLDANDTAFNSQIATVPSDAASFDWTRLPITSSMPDHIRFARSVDWAATSLGPIEDWSSDLRQMCNLIMASPHPAAMYWGEDLIAIYNEAYILLAGQKHPGLMGKSYRVAWAEIWDNVKEFFASALTTGQATMKDDDCLFMRRSDHLEETYFSWSIIPMVGRDGSVMGLYNPAFEKTRRKIAERRMLTLREVGERTAAARDVKAFWSQVLGSFEFNEYDSPFLLLYSVSDEGDSDSSSIHSNSVFASRQAILEGSLGVPEGHHAAPGQIDLKSGVEGFAPVFKECLASSKPVLLEVGTRDLPESLMEGLEVRGFGDPIRAVVVCPIHPTTGDNVLGFLVLGINPRRPYDDDYSLFVQLLSRQLATSLASVVLFEEEIRRGQKAAQLAALDRIELSEKLAARTAEAIESETKFTRMAEFAPVGMFIANNSGKITFANDTWYDISRVPKNASMADTWMDAVKPEDMDLVKQSWRDLVDTTKPVSIEFRFKVKRRDMSGNSGDTWVLFSGYPEKYDDGRLKSIFGSMTDISQQKWAEGLQTRKMEEAVELKRQQENFIDITSHEMRNPLSAILQCADEITASMTRFRQSGDRVMPDDLVTSCLDAAQTINLCSQHQKRIVDDILTLSKLDSQLLLVTPVDAQPLTVVQRALKMHEGELHAADIQMKFVVHQSFRDLGLDWVRFDPSRVLQVLINLTTNAIKFTGTEHKRTITVTIAATVDRPSDRPDAPVRYFPTRKKNLDTLSEAEWGQGDKVYIHFAVRDTGRGLSPEEKKLLFMRFSQASPRTHVQYGGSGLGLFISRELTELQGGEIGVESEAGKGSIFAFYVAARKSTQPADNTDGSLNVRRHNPPSSRSKSEPSAQPQPDSNIQRVEGVAPEPQPASNGTQAGIKKVLIVEDNLVNQRVLQKQLKNIGTEVHLANHGGEALEKLMQSTYWREDTGAEPRLELGVVLMDQEMPIMDGLTCTRKIREFEAEGKLTGHVPIIAVTANARPEQIQTALDAGMDSVIAKPFRIPDLIPRIEELMEKYPMPA